MTKIKYGQIGVGHGHASKIQVYRDSDDFDVVGIAEDDPQLRAAAANASAFRDLRWMTTEELLNASDVQVIGVETTVKKSLATAELAIAAGKHIHLDKPAGESLPQFQRLLNDAARKHLSVQMGYMYRYNPGIVLLRDWLKRGWLGRVFEVHAVMSKRLGAEDRRELLDYSGGSMFELGCHLIDLVVAILGVPEHVHDYPRHSADSTDGYLDNMLAVFEYPQATATIRSSMLEVDGFSRRHLAVCGTEGTLHLQPLDSPTATVAFRVERPGHPAATHTHTLPRFTRYVADAQELARVVRQQQEPTFSYAHDLQVQRATLLASGMSTE